MKKLLILPLALISVAAYSGDEAAKKSEVMEIRNHSTIVNVAMGLMTKCVQEGMEKEGLAHCSLNRVKCLAFSWKHDAKKTETTVNGTYLLPNGIKTEITVTSSPADKNN